MKRLLISFFVLCLFLFYSYFSEKFVLNLCSDINDILETCASEIKEEKYSQAESTVSKLVDLWKENDRLLCVFIGDTTVTEPENSILTLQRCLEDKNYTYCLYEIRECQSYLHEITEGTETAFGNML